MSDSPASSPRPGGTTRLGGRHVARVGLGAMQLGEHAPDLAAAVAVVRRAVDLGVDHLDTASFYGRANEAVRAALWPYPEEVVLATKVGAVRSGDGLVAAQRPEELRAQVRSDLTALGTEHLDVVNLRRLDAGPGILAEGEQVVDLDDQLAALLDLRAAGVVGAIGLSNVDAAQVTRALPAGIVCVQNVGSLLDRTAEPAHDVCRLHDLAWVPFFPLGSAFPGRLKVTEHPEVVGVANRLGATPAQVGLAWLLADDERTLLIPGTSDASHLEENLAAGSLVLDEAAIEALGRVARRGHANGP